MLNAFRHQRRKHRTRLCQLLIDLFVLNAFRHQRRKHSLVPSLCHRSKRCSTPFGINEGNIGNYCDHCYNGFMCSTPFGINEGNIHSLSAHPNATSCAQRLSASTKETSVVRQSHNSSIFACSTPFGINEGNIPAFGFYDNFHTFVLNAFRHQRRKHSSDYVIGEPYLIVLNAFRHQRRKHSFDSGSKTSTVSCAQRLSASTKETCFDWIDLTSRAHVLNAFRHQRRKHSMKTLSSLACS